MSSGILSNICYNTVVISGNPFNSTESVLINLKSGNLSSLNIQNNILVSLRGDKVVIIDNANDALDLNMDNNVFYTTSANFANEEVVNYTFSDWQSTFGKDANSIIYNPTFVSATDLHLSALDQSLRLNNPISVVTTDIDGDLRDAVNPYSGADEIVDGQISILSNNSCKFEGIIFQISNTVNIQSFLWNFGDSQTSTDLEPIHTYANSGTYTVRLTVTYNDNSTGTVSKEITIYETPTPITILHD